jgi:hypothetical protein
MPNPMPSPNPAPGAEMLELLMTAASGMFPGPVLEALIARLEVGK